MEFKPGIDFSRSLDAADGLAALGAEFRRPPAPDGSAAIYLAGNSLGLQPKRAAQFVREELEDWQRFGVLGHHDARRPWIGYHEYLTGALAGLVGAQPQEVVQMNSTTTNLHLMMVSFYRPTPARHRIIIERGAFPSDHYAITSQLRFHGYDPQHALIEVGPRPGEDTIRPGDILATIEREGSSVALVLFSGVHYATGQAFDLPAIAQAARRQNCAVGFDLAHAVGNLELRLHDWAPDFAVWCSYKYLNGGPGAVAGCFVHERHARRPELPRFAGWWGQNKDTRFLMGPDFDPIPGAEGWQLSNPPVLGLAPLLASYELFAAASMARLRAKSVLLTDYLDYLLRDRVADAVQIVTPPTAGDRGCQLSLRLRAGRERGRAIFGELQRRGVISDWREPDIIRVAPVPLYNSFREVHDFVESLRAITRMHQ